ncbi:hypothetical protein FRC18_001550 [Serendipita sp. 400]|nr:hypothetical protein FRC18_001550 [Serendipita sp. 400]
MDQFTQFAVESTAVALFSVGLQLWRVYFPTTTTTATTPATMPQRTEYDEDDTSYLYFSLAAPTLVLLHHTIYFCIRSLPSVHHLQRRQHDQQSSYTLLQQSPSFSSSSRVLIKDEEGNWRETEEAEGAKSDTLGAGDRSRQGARRVHPFISTLPSILSLLLLTVLLGSFALSTLIVATIDDSSNSASASATTTSANTLNETFSASAIHPCSNSTASNVATLGLGQAAAAATAMSDGSTMSGGTLVLQGILSLGQTILLGLMSAACLRARFSARPDWEEEEVEDRRQEEGEEIEEGVRLRDAEGSPQALEVYYEVVVLETIDGDERADEERSS